MSLPLKLATGVAALVLLVYAFAVGNALNDMAALTTRHEILVQDVDALRWVVVQKSGTLSDCTDYIDDAKQANEVARQCVKALSEYYSDAGSY